MERKGFLVILTFLIGLIYGWFFQTWRIMIHIPILIREPNQTVLIWEIWTCYLIVLIAAFAFTYVLGTARKQ